MRTAFLSVAQDELDAAVAYYESERDGLGFRFAGMVKDALQRIILFPTAYQRVGKRARRCLVPRFPLRNHL